MKVVTCMAGTGCPVRWLKLPFRLGYVKLAWRGCWGNRFMSATTWQTTVDVIGGRL